MKTYKYLLLGLVVVLTTAGLVGCSGGGTSVRRCVPGDEWTWLFTGTVSNGENTVPVTGTMTATVTSQTVTTPHGIEARIKLQTMVMTADGKTTTDCEKVYFTQDDSGATLVYGGEDEGGVYWVTTPTTGYYIATPGLMDIGTSWGGTVLYSDGKSENISYTITATESVNVPAGMVETYRYTGSGTTREGNSTTMTSWYAPQIDAEAKSTMVGSDADGVSVNLTMELTKHP